MKKTLAKLAKLCFILTLLNGIAFADFKEHYDLGQTYMSQYQYPNAINEFKSALRINYLDNSARIGLINAYLARGTEYANKDKEWTKAADDFRSALFYLVYYPNSGAAQNSSSATVKVQNNLNNCLEFTKFDTSPQNRFNTAKRLRAEGNFPAAAYEFMQALGSKNLQAKSFEQVAEIMKILGNEPKAGEYYKKAVAVNPTNLDLRLAYAKILDNQNNEEDAMTEYSYVLQHLTSDNKEVLYGLERIFRKKLENNPKNGALYANMGAILQKQDKLDEALTYYKQAEALDPSNTNTRINTGTLYQQKGDYRTAIKAYESVLILYPNNINANLYRAQCYDKLGDNKVAQEGYRKVLELDPENEYIKNQLISNAKKTMTASAFIEYVNKNMENMHPADIFYDYAIELHKNGKLTDAITLYNEAIRLNGKSPEIYVNKALALAQGNNFDAAISTLQTASAAFPKEATITSTLNNINDMKLNQQMDKAATAYKNKDYKNAISYYLLIQPPTVDTMIGVATSYQELGDREHAIEYYKKALALKPVDSDIAYYIACLYGEDEKYEDAKFYLQKAIAFNKNNTQAIEYLQSIEENDRSNLLNSAIALYDEEKYDESLVKFNELLAKDSNNAYAFYYRGMIYDAKENRKEAISDLTKAYQLNKDFLICNYMIASDYDSLKDFKNAYKYYIAYANSNADDDQYKEYAKARAEELKDYAK